MDGASVQAVLLQMIAAGDVAGVVRTVAGIEDGTPAWDWFVDALDGADPQIRAQLVSGLARECARLAPTAAAFTHLATTLDTIAVPGPRRRRG
jgi:hypothetical protein